LRPEKKDKLFRLSALPYSLSKREILTTPIGTPNREQKAGSKKTFRGIDLQDFKAATGWLSEPQV
jgi:hypothetical protein